MARKRTVQPTLFLCRQGLRTPRRQCAPGGGNNSAGASAAASGFPFPAEGMDLHPRCKTNPETLARSRADAPRPVGMARRDLDAQRDRALVVADGAIDVFTHPPEAPAS